MAINYKHTRRHRIAGRGNLRHGQTSSKNPNTIRDPKKFVQFISKRDRKLLDRLEEYDRQQG
jgi:hypothetical protein